MVQINWTRQSLEDLKDIFEYISRDSEKYAKFQVIKLRNRVKILSSHNYSGKMIPEIKIENIRELIEGNYRIIYKIVSSDRIDILTVHHSSRDLSNRKFEMK